MIPAISNAQSVGHTASQNFDKQNRTKSRLACTREENYQEWYQEVIKEAELGEPSDVRGCMVIKPWGYGLWENTQRTLDDRFKESDISNVYFPLFIPLKFFQKEASHVDGFAKECAVVTHYRLTKSEKEGIIPDPEAKLDEPLIVRPTSETIIGAHFAKWVRSYRDLPIRVNQWANVVRWEHQTRMFLRTTEFLWQEGHTVHASREEAKKQALDIAELYRDFIENTLAIPVITGEKSPGERFAGAENSFTFEAMMQDRKALQAGTSHYLGQNFSKAFDIKFLNKSNEQEYGYTTSWGLTTRLIGALIMVHSDDDGLRLPPKIATKQIVIVPSIHNDMQSDEVFGYIGKLTNLFKKGTYNNRSLSILVDKREMPAGKKLWDWIAKGVPIRIEVGPRELEKQSVCLYRRDRSHKEKRIIPFNDDLVQTITKILEEMQEGYFSKAKQFRDSHIRKDITTLEEMKQFFTPKNPQRPEAHGGFVLAKWCGDPATETMLKEMNVTIRCLPFNQSKTEGPCILTGKPASQEAIFAKSY